MAKTEMIITTEVSVPSGITELTHVFKNPGTIAFENKYHHYIHPAALRGVDGLTIEGLQDAEIHFLAPLSGETWYHDAYRHDSGVLNLIDCKNVVISGAFENVRPYFAGTLSEQTATAVNVARSTVKFQNSKIFSAARLPFTAHSGSTVEIEDSLIQGDYFELFNGASSLTVRRCEIVQEASYPDSHTMLWTSSRHRSAVDNVAYDNGMTIFDACRFKMKSGRGLVSGNGSYDTKSTVEFRNGCVIEERDPAFGIVSWHSSYNSIEVNTNGNFEDYTTDIVRVGPGVTGFGNFVDYYQDGTGGKPGGENDAAPITVDGVVSSDIPE